MWKGCGERGVVEPPGLLHAPQSLKPPCVQNTVFLELCIFFFFFFRFFIHSDWLTNWQLVIDSNANLFQKHLQMMLPALWGSLSCWVGTYKVHHTPCFYVVKHVALYSPSHVWLFEAPCAVARQGSLSTGFPRRKYLHELPFPPPGDRLHPGMEPASPASPSLPGDSLPLSHQRIPVKDEIYPFMYPPGSRPWESQILFLLLRVRFVDSLLQTL